jgi:hypothetical protein
LVDELDNVVGHESKYNCKYGEAYLHFLDYVHAPLDIVLRTFSEICKNYY